MRKRLQKLGLIGLLMVLALPLQSKSVLKVKGAARITYASGIANVRKSQIVGPGRVIFTGKNGRVAMAFADGSRIRVGPNSHFKLIKYNPGTRSIVGRLSKGRVWSRVKKNKNNKVIIRGRYSTAAVLGTTWNFDVSDTSTKTTVLEGSVGVHRPFETISDENPDALMQQTPQPLFPTPAAPGTSNTLSPPTEIASPVHEIAPPIKVVPGPYEVSKEQWLEIVQNQSIEMGANGIASIEQIDPQKWANKDPWFQWNQDMDKNAVNDTE